MPLPFWMYRFASPQQVIVDLILQPLVESYNVVSKDFNALNYEENLITEKLVWFLKKQSSISTLYQKRTMDVILRPKEQVTIDTKSEPDIKFIIGSILWLQIEAKRIYEKQNWSSAEYLSDGSGIGRFLSGMYSKDEEYGAMLGYVQGGNFQEIIKNIKDKLSDKDFKEYKDTPQIENCLVSVHRRFQNSDITIYHLFFYFSH